MIYRKQCKMCGLVHDIEVDRVGFWKWRDGELIQNALPNVSLDNRELMISGICGKCFDDLFGESNDRDCD